MDDDLIAAAVAARNQCLCALFPVSWSAPRCATSGPNSRRLQYRERRLSARTVRGSRRHRRMVWPAAGGRRAAVAGAGDGLVTPCGGCRQKLREFARRRSMPITSAMRRGRCARTFTLDELLPSSFGPENLGPANHERGSRISEQSARELRRGRRDRPGSSLERGGRRRARPPGPFLGRASRISPVPKVSGHAGALVAGARSAPTRHPRQWPRASLRERAMRRRCARSIETICGIGTRAIILTNAAGSLDSAVRPGPHRCSSPIT